MNLDVNHLDEKSVSTVDKYTHVDPDKVGDIWEILKNAIFITSKFSIFFIYYYPLYIF